MIGVKRNSKGKTMKLWEKGTKLNGQIENFTVGEDFHLDQKLVIYDCLASIAHVKMLGKIGILTKKEAQELESALHNIIELDKKGEFKILKEQEDCHTSIENYLVKNLGDVGKKIHTARSRNDQILTALRLYYKDKLSNCLGMIEKLIQTINAFLERYGDIKFTSPHPTADTVHPLIHNTSTRTAIITGLPAMMCRTPITDITSMT